MKYYKTDNGIGQQEVIPAGVKEITKKQYDNFLCIIRGIPSKDGFTKTVKLNDDGTYEVTYTPFEEDTDDNYN